MRLMVSRDALLPITVAAKLVGGRSARDWLEKNVRIRWIAGQRRVLWADVIAATESEASPSCRKPRKGPPKLRLADLD